MSSNNIIEDIIATLKHKRRGFYGNLKDVFIEKLVKDFITSPHRHFYEDLQELAIVDKEWIQKDLQAACINKLAFLLNTKEEDGE